MTIINSYVSLAEGKKIPDISRDLKKIPTYPQKICMQ